MFPSTHFYLRFRTLWKYTTLKLFLGDNHGWNALELSENTLLSNTPEQNEDNEESFRTLWKYTTLKPKETVRYNELGFRTLWKYTTLKHQPDAFGMVEALELSENTLLSNSLAHQ